jgi:hypothetical protein
VAGMAALGFGRGFVSCQASQYSAGMFRP